MSPIKTPDQPPTHDAAVAVKPIKGAVRPLLSFSGPAPQLETDLCWVLLLVAQSEVEKLTIKAVRVLACELTQQVRFPLDHLRTANPLTLVLFLIMSSTREVTLERPWEPLPSVSLSGSTRCASTPTTPTGSPEIVRSSRLVCIKHRLLTPSLSPLRVLFRIRPLCRPRLSPPVHVPPPLRLPRLDD